MQTSDKINGLFKTFLDLHTLSTWIKVPTHFIAHVHVQTRGKMISCTDCGQKPFNSWSYTYSRRPEIQRLAVVVNLLQSSPPWRVSLHFSALTPLYKVVLLESLERLVVGRQLVDKLATWWFQCIVRTIRRTICRWCLCLPVIR